MYLAIGENVECGDAIVWVPQTWGRQGMLGFNVYLHVFWRGFNVDAYVPLSFALVHIERL